MQAWGC